MDRLKAYAKINWILTITGVENGFHSLDGLMETTGLYDCITINVQRGQGVNTVFDGGLQIEDDLCTKAAMAFLRETGIDAKVDIHVEKHIPMGAGLGGGSSDCACVLSYLNQHFGSPVLGDRLQRMAADLGADVAFFLYGGCQRARGKGEILEPVVVASPIDIIIAMPKGRGVSTQKAFAIYDGYPKKSGGDVAAMISARISGDTKAMALAMHNDLEAPSIELLAEIGQVQEALLAAGCIGAIMTGSGSAVIGIIGQGQIDLSKLKDFWYRVTKTGKIPFCIEKNPCN